MNVAEIRIAALDRAKQLIGSPQNSRAVEDKARDVVKVAKIYETYIASGELEDRP
jgi:hypothetical protein